MPDNVRFQDLASLVDFMYLGEVSVPHEDLPLFMALAKQFKVGITKSYFTAKILTFQVRGLSDYGPHGERKVGKAGRAPSTGPRGMPAGPNSMHSDIRQRLPPGIQMVREGWPPQMKRPGGEGSPVKRPRLGPAPGKAGHGMPHQGHYPEEEEEEDDITEIREGEDSSDYYDNYEQNYDEHVG